MAAGKLQRIAQIGELDPDGVAEYERLHAEVWPAVVARITASHIHNYSIFRHGSMLFSYMEYTGDDLEADLAASAADPETQRWWAVLKPLQKKTDGPKRDESEHLPEVFHLD